MDCGGYKDKKITQNCVYKSKSYLVDVFISENSIGFSVKIPNGVLFAGKALNFKDFEITRLVNEKPSSFTLDKTGNYLHLKYDNREPIKLTKISSMPQSFEATKENI